jgi:hypothetical protein
MTTRTFNVKGPNSTEGVNYTYTDENLHFVSVEIKDALSPKGILYIIENLKPLLPLFLNWAESMAKVTVVELNQQVTFEMFWLKYNDRERSSRKRCLAMWDKFSKDNQVKAYYFIDTYNRNRGTAEKKYCETYLKSELWNN